MAHLDDHVAAFVDGQLSPRATKAAERHLEDCDRCRQAVEDQRHLKARMRLSGAPGVPGDLLASLAGVPSTSEPERRSWWSRLARSGVTSVGVVLVGASLAVVVVAYGVGASVASASADEVTPDYDAYVVDFGGGESTADGTMTVATMTSLDEQGWPCHSRLGADLERTDGRWHEGSSDTLAITYSDGERRLRLFEQNGRLDDDGPAGFRARQVDGHRVWVRPGSPKVVTWDADGVVYTIVTDVQHAELVDAMRLLPYGPRSRSHVERVEDGMRRMAGWMGAA